MLQPIVGCWQMIRNIQFELYKVEREIKLHGETYEVHRDNKDEYGEAADGNSLICSFCGIFHTSRGFTTRSTTVATTTRNTGSPMILAVFSDCEKIQKGDYIMINDVRYEIVDKNNIEEQNIVVDMSLERVSKDGV